MALNGCSTVCMLTSSLQDAFMITGGSTLRTSGVDVTDFTDIQGSLYDISGSEAIIDNIVVSDNQVPASSRWSGIRSRNEAQVRVRNSLWMDNSNLNAAVQADGASVDVDGMAISTMSGVNQVRSSRGTAFLRPRAHNSQPNSLFFPG